MLEPMREVLDELEVPPERRALRVVHRLRVARHPQGGLLLDVDDRVDDLGALGGLDDVDLFDRDAVGRLDDVDLLGLDESR